ncbi:hypothetical protein M9Y10_027625 [Tritrichomonas musculus]|uniref:Homeobox domain-containing protein n=1 Tax=Tritrichomonas musculus TaxID=1915356 RepID=A0ABR2H3N0_9EUKA
MQNIDPNSRYYPTPAEYNILIPYIKKYFSFPERSQRRYSVVQEAAKALKPLNQHWNNNTVRKWFNNNKYQYRQDIIKDGIIEKQYPHARNAASINMKCPFNFQHFQQDIFGNLQQFLCYVNNQLPENESPDIFYRFKLPREGIPIEVYENQVHQDEAQFQTNYDQNYQMNQQPQPSQFAQIYQAQPQQEVSHQQKAYQSCVQNYQMNQQPHPSQFAQIYQAQPQQEVLPQQQAYQDEAQFQTNYDQNYQMNQQPHPSQFAPIYQAQPQQEVLLQQQICQMQAQLLSLEQTTSQTAPSFQQYRQAIQNTHGNPLNIIVNSTKIDQYQDYHQILNRQQQLSPIPQYNEINKNTTISVASKNDEIYLQVPSYPINDSLSTVTPGDLINCFRKLNKQTINSLEDLVHYIHDVSISLGSPFVSVKTGPTRKIQQFACQFHNSNYQCKALVSYYYDKETNTIFLEEMCNQHTHPISEILPTKSRNTLTYLQRSRIQIATQEGFKATTIKRKENLVCSKDVLKNYVKMKLRYY